MAVNKPVSTTNTATQQNLWKSPLSNFTEFYRNRSRTLKLHVNPYVKYGYQHMDFHRIYNISTPPHENLCIVFHSNMKRNMEFACSMIFDAMIFTNSVHVDNCQCADFHKPNSVDNCQCADFYKPNSCGQLSLHQLSQTSFILEFFFFC